MASAADPSSNHHSPELAGDGAGVGVGVGIGVDSPRLRRGNLSSQWAKVVRGEPESIPAVHQSPPSSSSSLSSLASSASEQIPFSDCSPSKAAPAPAPDASSSSPPPPVSNSAAAENINGNNSGNAGKPKKPAWNKLSNGVVEAGSVMDAVSWPALSESARASPKPSADSSSKPLADGSISISQGPVKTHSPKKQANTNANPNSTQNHPFQTRQRSMKRGGSGGTGGGPAHSNFTHAPPPPPPPPPPAFPIIQMPPNAYRNIMPAIPDPSPRDPPFRRPVPGPGFMSQPQHPVNDHRNSSRRGNFIHHPPGDGPYHNNYGGRRDQDRGNFANGRDAHIQPQRGPPPPSPRGFVRPAPSPPNATAFITPPHARPFPNPMGFQDVVYLPFTFDPIRGGPYIPHPPVPQMFAPPAESLPTLIVNQIEYYFSDENLVKDEYLRSNMDDQGWVPISLIASFPRVKNLTSNIQLIVSSLGASSLVEVQDDKVRRRRDWKKWVQTSGRLSTEPGLLSSGNSSQNLLAASLQKITLDEVAPPSQKSITCKADHNPEDGPDQHSTELSAQSRLVNGEVPPQITH